MRRPTLDEQPIRSVESVERAVGRLELRRTSFRVGAVAVVGYLCLVLAGVALGAVVTAADGTLFDELAFMTTISENRSALLTDAAAFFGSFSDTWTVIGMAAGAIVVLGVSRLGRQVTVLGIGLAVELAGYLSITYLVDRPRPSVEATAALPSTPSFPSGHVAAAVVLYAGLAIIVWSLDASRSVRTAAAVVAVVVPTLVGLSRVYEGLHYPTDVVAGALLGAASLGVAVTAAGLVPIASRPGPTAPSTALVDETEVSTYRSGTDDPAELPQEDTPGATGKPSRAASEPDRVALGPFAAHIPRPSHILLRSRALVVATATFGVVLGLVAGLRPEWLLPVDEPVTRAVRGDALIGFFRFWTQLGSQQEMILAATAIGVLLWARCRPFAVAFPAAVLVGVVVDVTVKIIVDRPRPPEPLVGTALGSFPSGHALTGVIFFGLLPPALWIALGRRLLFWISVPLSVVAAILVALSRVYLGGHWPSDVVASALLGASILLGTEWLLGTRFARRHCDGCPLHQRR